MLACLLSVSGDCLIIKSTTHIHLPAWYPESGVPGQGTNKCAVQSQHQSSHFSSSLEPFNISSPLEPWTVPKQKCELLSFSPPRAVFLITVNGCMLFTQRQRGTTSQYCHLAITLPPPKPHYPWGNSSASCSQGWKYILFVFKVAFKCFTWYFNCVVKYQFTRNSS